MAVAKRYGVCYKGSKSKIANFVLDNLPASPVFVDLFAGGCAVTDKARETHKYGAYVINDIDTAPDLYLDAISGKLDNETRWIAREDFEALKDSEPYVRWCWSFGNNGEDYLYSKEVEPWKKALHYARVFGDCSLFKSFGIDTDGSSADIIAHHEEYLQKYKEWFLLKYYNTTETAQMKMQELEQAIATESESLRMYLRHSLEEAGIQQSEVNRRLGTQMAGHYFGKSQWAFPTREEYEKMQEFMPLPQPYDEVHGLKQLLEDTKALEQFKALTSLQRLQSLQRLEGTQRQASGETITRLRNDYKDVSIPDASFYYADPPYRNTSGYGDKVFDFDGFDEWLATVDKPVIVSEYTQPAGTVEVARIDRYSTLGKNDHKVVERLFIQERYLDWYKEQMKEERLV